MKGTCGRTRRPVLLQLVVCIGERAPEINSGSSGKRESHLRPVIQEAGPCRIAAVVQQWAFGWAHSLDPPTLVDHGYQSNRVGDSTTLNEGELSGQVSPAR